MAKQSLITGIATALLGGFVAYVIGVQLGWTGEIVAGYGTLNPLPFSPLLPLLGG